MNLKTPLYSLTGIGHQLSYKLKRLNLETVEDLIYHFPFRYDDFSQSSTIKDAQIGQVVTLQGEIWSIANIYTRYGKVLTQAIFNDGTSPLTLTWFNQPYLTKQIKTGDRLQISGKLTKYKNKLSIMVPKWEKVENSLPTTDYRLPTLHTGRLVPIYPETEGLTSKWLRTKVSQLFPQVSNLIVDPLPESIKRGMLSLFQSLSKIHFPQNYQDVEKSRDRLGFDELFFVALATKKARLEWSRKPLIKPLTITENDLNRFIKELPFTLTSAQTRVLGEIISDLKRNQPMNRLIQGEVGSGKTVVAAIICYLVYKNSQRTLFMAPTEILAFQHFETISKLLEPFGISVGIYTGSRKYHQNKAIRIKNKGSKKLNSRFLPLDSNPSVIIGTHALLSDKLNTKDVGLIIVDEQQRFGVEQRTFLRSKAKIPHFLTLTATPIPRTVALTLYGDLDLSIIDELPKDRQKIKTYLVPARKRDDAYKFIEKQIKTGDQAYIITPLIDLSETLQSVRAATEEFERLQKKVFHKFKLALLHGRLSSRRKDEVMRSFREKKIDILVSTSVVEVGVDVPNATIMVVESSERFGLAQLHQLRGRVGRGSKQSYCLLFTDIEAPQIIRRLKNLETISDGLKLAELDLKIRGGGEVFGTKQSGRFEFKIASLSNLTLVEETRNAAQKLLLTDPTLDKHPLIRAKLESLAANVMPD
ncbi:ATP-dependent DNA helicase RecG [Candidatus Daviesbacteria bacterium]|nr:ATP-dependent DNA helicase RecG [Candidatus Daviesbacteria bacterium]